MANILIIKLGALGDVVMSTSLVQQILDTHPEDCVSLITCKPYDKLFCSFENLRIHTIKRKGLLNTLQNIRWIREHSFKRVYDLQSNDRTSLYCALSGVSERVGNHPRFPYNIHPEDPYNGQCHIYQRMLSVLQSAGINAFASPPTLHATKEEKNKVASWLQNNNVIKNEFIIIHAGCSKQRPDKRWPYFGDLAQSLSKQTKTIVWVGAKDEEETNNQLAKITGVNASNEFSFSELAELGRHAAFAITNDSGPMHILSCSGIPVYSFFGPTNWKRNHAIGQERNVLAAQPLDSIKDYQDKDFYPASLDSITPDLVINKLSDDQRL